MQMLPMNPCLSYGFKSKLKKRDWNFLKCNSLIKDDKLSRSFSETKKYTTKKIKNCSKKQTETILRITKKNL